MTLILFVFLSLLVIAVVTINCALLALAVYLWRKWITALRGFKVLDNAYQSVVTENGYLRAVLSGRIEMAPCPTKEAPLFVANRSNTLH